MGHSVAIQIFCVVCSSQSLTLSFNKGFLDFRHFQKNVNGSWWEKVSFEGSMEIFLKSLIALHVVFSLKHLWWKYRQKQVCFYQLCLARTMGFVCSCNLALSNCSSQRGISFVDSSPTRGRHFIICPLRDGPLNSSTKSHYALVCDALPLCFLFSAECLVLSLEPDT